MRCQEELVMEAEMIQRCKMPEVAMFPEGGIGLGCAVLQSPSWTLEELLKACHGRLLYGESQGAFGSISTDTRTIKPGDIFLALNGETFDGANYVHEAIKKGAACIITEKVPEKKISAPCIIVSDSLYALGELAKYRRRLLKDIKVIGITGSSGKTTVKEMTAAILEHQGEVIKTKGNFNNLIGLPLSLLPANYCHEFALLEMGMNREGEIARLTEIANPDVACILNVHSAHIAGLGSIEGVARAKGELFRGCSAGAKVIVNLDDKRVAALSEVAQGTKITFGLKKGSFVRASNIVNQGVRGMLFNLHIGDEMGQLSIKALGLHNVSNCLAAAAMAHAVGVSCTDIISGLENFEATTKRLEICTNSRGILLFNDSYNANPASMRAAIETISGMREGVKVVAVLGDMLELGDYSLEAHQEIGAMVAGNDFNYLLAIGEYSKIMVEAARLAGMPEDKALSFSDRDALAESLEQLVSDQLVQKGDLILFKGSRGMRMETFMERLLL